jgi:hypothetical protein
LNEYWVNKRPDDPEIRIVHTLEPLESMKIYKKGGLQLYMVGGPGIKTKNRNNNSKNKNIRFWFLIFEFLASNNNVGNENI